MFNLDLKKCKYCAFFSLRVLSNVVIKHKYVIFIERCECKHPQENIDLVKKCKTLRCKMYCKDGFEKDENGCNICKCKLPSKGVLILILEAWQINNTEN